METRDAAERFDPQRDGVMNGASAVSSLQRGGRATLPRSKSFGRRCASMGTRSPSVHRHAVAWGAFAASARAGALGVCALQVAQASAIAAATLSGLGMAATLAPRL